ncbi:TonB-dependent receptor [Algoriphagus hitonicola]|uniref:Iron complex outermembrane recepter protein n=1 Tax=Algoriphagus hitonicola TaxID=435880 RepID=A0A1I2WZB5_9BACT|nr:TonB-dependent receptor [Algoriphagus hitonicola]SFH06615.1 iron complex outermembrane recepter protein [Algoriphagus hitonicola]
MILFVWVLSFFGQIPEKQDTVSLSEIEVNAAVLERYSQGQKQITWKKEDLALVGSQSLGELLSAQSPVFIREYGPGMLASPSFRGTSAGHTAIFWNGMPLNSPSLGQSDLSLLPVFAFESASLHFGSNGALIGNEAIGGSLHLNSENKFDQGSEFSFTQEIGSFGQSNTQLKGSFSSKKFYSQTKFYRHFTENNFSFRNLALPETPIQKQHHARVNQQGIVQDLAWKITENKKLKTALWYHDADREIQPPMGSSTQDQQQDQSLRWVLDYERYGDKSTIQLKTGFIAENQIFNESLNRTKQFILGAEWDYQAHEHWFFHLGTRFTHQTGELSTYQALDQRAELFQSVKFEPSEKLDIALNLRQIAYSERIQPWIPSLGLGWTFWENRSQELKLNLSGGKGFKVPTLNDRFWSPGGNPDLLPENSWTSEAGLEWKSGTLEQSLTGYYMNVDNWIIWLPQGNVWSPENIRKVRSEGIEYQGKVFFKTGEITWTNLWQYSLNRAVSIRGISENDPSLGKQLPYTPQHQANFSIKAHYRAFYLFAQNTFTGKRNVTADNPRTLDAFSLSDLALGCSGFQLGDLKIPVQFRIQNLFNTEYQVLYLRPMPGRSYHINLSIQL